MTDITINLGNLTADEKRLVLSLSQHIPALFHASLPQHFKVIFRGEPVTLHMQGRLVKYITCKTKEERLGYFTEALGQGANMAVYKILKTAPTNTFVFKDKDNLNNIKQRVLKAPLMEVTNVSTYEGALAEVIQTPPHLKPTLPVKIIQQNSAQATNDMINPDSYGFLLKYIHGIELFSFIDDSKYNLLRTDPNFLKITCAVFEAVYKNIQKYGLAHNDIKPENIIIKYDEVTHAWSAEIVDFGLASSPLNQFMESARGTPEYMHYKAFFGEIDYTTDIASLGFVISVLYNDIGLCNILPENYSDRSSHINAIQQASRDYPFKDIESSWGEAFLSQMRELLISMTREDNVN